METIKRWLSKLSFRTGVIVLAMCVPCYLISFFPVIPWIFMYVFGYHLGNLLLNNNTFTKLGSRRIPILSWLGTKSLLVYIIHQPICYGIVWLICR